MEGWEGWRTLQLDITEKSVIQAACLMRVPLPKIFLSCLILFFVGYPVGASADLTTGSEAGPKVLVPTDVRKQFVSKTVRPIQRGHYPWKKYITATIFWCGEQPTARNPTPNCKSSWDTEWAKNFGGYDNPDPKERIANHETGVFRPKKFVPKLNPFYIALPYNDVKKWNQHKPEASRVIPWFSRKYTRPGKTVLKGKWVQMYYKGRSCYAQWEDCGPWVTDDWRYVFGSERPKARENGGAGIDLSPSVRDYLRLKSGAKLHWRFVEASEVPYGPWKKFGYKPEKSKGERRTNRVTSVADGKSIEEQRAYMEMLRRRRDAEFAKKPLKRY